MSLYKSPTRFVTDREDAIAEQYAKQRARDAAHRRQVAERQEHREAMARLGKLVKWSVFLLCALAFAKALLS